MARRKWRRRYAEYYRQKLSENECASPKPKDTLPRSPLPTREGLGGSKDGELTVSFLNEARTFRESEIDWRPPDQKYGTRLWLLHLHYMEFLESLPDRHFVSTVEDWINNVPPYQDEYWLDTWNSYALSIRCVTWMQEYARRRERLPQPFRKRVRGSIARQLRFLTDHLEVDIGGNHLIKNIKALLWGGRFFESEEAETWQKKGSKLLSDQLREQILRDGVHYERSPAYHVQVFTDLVECHAVLTDGTLKERVCKRLNQMAQVTADLTHPDGRVSLFNDGGLNMTYDPAECLRVWEERSGEKIAPRSVFQFPEAGYYGLNVRDEYILVDCGKVAPDSLPAHGHGDILSFEWSIGAQRLIVDAGVYEYNPGPRRVYSRSTMAHNTVSLAGEDQCEFWDAFRVGRRARVLKADYEDTERGFRFTGAHDGYRHLAGSPVHKRIFNVEPGLIEVDDRVSGGNGQRAEARLLLAPDCAVEYRGDDLEIEAETETVLLEADANSVDIRDAKWYPDFGVEQTCNQLVLRYDDAPCRGGFRLKRV